MWVFLFWSWWTFGTSSYWWGFFPQKYADVKFCCLITLPAKISGKPVSWKVFCSSDIFLRGVFFLVASIWNIAGTSATNSGINFIMCYKLLPTWNSSGRWCPWLHHSGMHPRHAVAWQCMIKILKRRYSFLLFKVYHTALPLEEQRSNYHRTTISSVTRLTTGYGGPEMGNLALLPFIGSLCIL